jgi:murein DD-endopeptidase MepM/ murein hydrolase activator NlpD
MTDWAKGGAYGGNIHNGMDYVQGCGSPIRAAADGNVVRDNRTDGSGFGHYIMIRHDNGLMTLYGHMI